MASNLAIGLTTLAFLICSLKEASSKVYQISEEYCNSTTSTDLYNSIPCLTISQFAANSGNYLTSNTTLVFLSGRSHLFNTILLFSNLVHFSMTSKTSTTAKIECTGENSYISFRNSQHVHITNLEFIGCAFNQVENVAEFVVKDTKFRGVGNTAHRSALKLVRTSARIVNCTFVSNGMGSTRYFYYDFFHPYRSRFLAQVGGAIFATRSNIVISQSAFVNNRVKDFGGTIFAEQSSIIRINNSSFINNTATYSGGVIYSVRSTVMIEMSDFAKNTASGSLRYTTGGVLYSDRSSITIRICNFTDNSAGRHGGVLMAEKSTISSNNDYFSSNSAGLQGGVLQAEDCTINSNGDHFNNNQAKNGGVMWSLNSTINSSNDYFNNNSAGLQGGVLQAEDCTINSNGDHFNNNQAKNGGVMWALNSTVNSSNDYFNNSSARLQGGVLQAEDCTINSTSDHFNNNQAKNGGVMWSLNSTINSNNDYFINSRADGNGGVMWTLNSTINGNNDHFNNSRADGNGGVVRAESRNNITMYNSSFDNSDSGYCGGVISAWYSNSITVYNSCFDSNKAHDNGGVMYTHSSGSITVYNSFFNNNEASYDGGVMYANSSTSIIVHNSSFNGNGARYGGVIYAWFSIIITVYNSSFNNNVANYGGGAMYADFSISVSVYNCIFNKNVARYGGVVYVLYSSSISVYNCDIFNNKAADGGVIAMLISDVLTVTETVFTHNNANKGGVIYLQAGNTVNVDGSYLSHNSANIDGGVIYSENENKLSTSNSNFNHNVAENNGGVVCSLMQTELSIGGDECNFVGNVAHSGGVVYATESRVDVHSQSVLMDNNTASETGGAIHLSKTHLTFFSNNNMGMNNATELGAENDTEGQPAFSSKVIIVGSRALNGGAIYASESKVIIERQTQAKIDANSAENNGGGLYLRMSQLKIRGNGSNISRNKAGNRGGGLHADHSSIIIEGATHFTNNEAENGGGVSLERYAKFYGMSTGEYINSVDFTSNVARRYGGAVYVNDKTNPDICVANGVQNVTLTNECFSMSVFMNLSNNSAFVSGSNLFGGLLDRCKVRSTTSRESEKSRPVGIVRFLSSSNIHESELDSISSHPVQLCFCKNGQPDCNYQPETIQVTAGNAISVELIAYDHTSRAVQAHIDSSLNASKAGSLGEGQDIQQINPVCTKLHFNIFSPRNLEQSLTLRPVQGPCNASQQTIMIEITCSCPIGFQLANNDSTRSCECVCNKVFQSYPKTKCNVISQTIIRQDNFWVAYIKHSNSTGYVLYSNCPYDYCHPPEKQVQVNLNIPKGSDAQCSLNRLGTLCGSCQPGFSVSLGSSSCLLCPPYWPGLVAILVTVLILSGIGLVVLILVCNLTVAIGTLNAIIFYGNIMAANKNALFSKSEVTFTSVLISWLNFDLGFDACFFHGMDTYVKTWLQLAFPAYIILLVGVIIQISYRFVSFGRLIGKKDPVATLATLILLSYAKLLQTIITAFSSATLYYLDKSKITVWLPDASIQFFSVKHAMLFFTATLILIVGLVYTLLLFSWQWFLRCPRKRVMFIKLSSFLEIYHVPYRQNHRYWTGLLLLVRVVVYLVSAANLSNDPRLTLLSTTFVVSCLFVYMVVFGIRVYKNPFINAMENVTYFNIIATSIFSWYTLDSDNTHQTAVTNISVGITFTQLMLIISYHAYRHTNEKLFSRIQKTLFCVKLKEHFQQKKIKRRPQPADNDIHQFHKLLDVIDRPVNTNDYNILQVKCKSGEPTQSVVELPKPHLAPPPLLQEIKEEPESESQHQLSKEDCVTVLEKNLSSRIDENKVCVNNCSGVEIPEFDEHPVPPGNEMNCSPMVNIIDQSPEQISSFGLPEKVDSPHTIVVELDHETHNNN